MNILWLVYDTAIVHLKSLAAVKLSHRVLLPPALTPLSFLGQSLLAFLIN